jgi:hypothetical protein
MRRVARLALDHVGDRRAGQDRAHGVRGLAPDGSAGRGVGADLALEQLDHLEDGDLARRAGEAVAALDAALRLEDPGAAQRGEQPLEELHRDVAGAREVADRHRGGVAPARQLRERPDGVGRLARDHQHGG